MQENTPSPEHTPIPEQLVIDTLNEKGIDDVEAKELLGQYQDQCHREADAEAIANKDDELLINRAHIKADVKIARLILKIKSCREYARDLLEEVSEVACQEETTRDLKEEIWSLLDELDECE